MNKRIRLARHVKSFECGFVKSPTFQNCYRSGNGAAGPAIDALNKDVRKVCKY